MTVLFRNNFWNSPKANIGKLLNFAGQSNGISIIPVLTGKEQPKHQSLNWEFQLDGWFRKMPDGGFRQSARIDNWKGVRYGIESETELYNLDVDISESNNIASDHP